MDIEDFHAHRHTLSTPAGELAYVDIGDGPPAVFVHGVLLSSYMWRDAIAELRSERRCLAFDLPGHGRSPLSPQQNLALPDFANLLERFCAALDLDAIDLVANDTGGAVAQIFAAHHRERLRTLTLTNCDAHDEAPPASFEPTVQAARAGQLAPALVELAAHPDRAREALAQGFEHPQQLPDETIGEYFAPFSDLYGAEGAERAISPISADDLLAVEPLLATLDTPTLIAWGTGDTFFDVSLAYWLRDAIARAERVVEIDDGKLFWPAERASELVALLREHWAAHAPLQPSV
jgi:pimeloyl-ACP methyl ester carboxylesterase